MDLVRQIKLMGNWRTFGTIKINAAILKRTWTYNNNDNNNICKNVQQEVEDNYLFSLYTVCTLCYLTYIVKVYLILTL